MGIKTALLFPDCHCPFQHVRACKLTMQIAQAIKIDAIYVLGDFVDMYYVSGHGPKHPSMAGHLNDEIDAANSGLDTFDKLFPSIPKYMIEGNHEFRLERYIQNKAPELWGMIDIQSLLKLNSRPGWRFSPYGPSQMVQVFDSDLWVRHEPQGSSGKATLSRSMVSIAFGHDHRLHETNIVRMDGVQISALGCGWLGNKSYDKAFGYVKSHHDWHLGFRLVYYDDATKKFSTTAVHIKDEGKYVWAVVGGVKYETS